MSSLLDVLGFEFPDKEPLPFNGQAWPLNEAGVAVPLGTPHDCGCFDPPLGLSPLNILQLFKHAVPAGALVYADVERRCADPGIRAIGDRAARDMQERR